MKQLVSACKIIALLIISVASVVAQSSSRPKIGVTLSGGGAKGFAHVGILQAMDSAGLKVDFITGTSMGSVVGGLYASGYSGDSIEAIARKLDWSLLFSTSPQLNAIGIEEKDEFNKYAIEIPLVKGKVSLGTGIIEGQELWLKFAELFHPVHNITDFSKLPTPFKCIGTDLATGDAVVMGKGNIITCIRASMAIPSVFTPVQYEGKTLVDGGVVNNFPVLDVKKMGADIVIGVNLNKGLDKAEDLTSMFDILLQLAFFKDADYFDKHRKACDIYILPELRGFSTGDFAAADSIIDIGKEVGRRYYPIFKKIADSLNAIYGKVPFVKNRLPKTEVIKIDSYSVDGLKRTTPKFFFGLMGLEKGVVFSHEKLAESIRTVYGSRYYKKISYDFVPDDSTGNTGLRFNVAENSMNAVKLGLNYNTFTNLSLIFNLTSRDLLLRESRALVTVAVSENPRIYAEYFKYVGKRRKIGLNLSFFKESIDYPLYSDFDLYETTRSNYFYLDFRLQYTINRNSYLGASHQFNSSKLRSIENPDYTFKSQNQYSHSYLSYQFNDVDKKYFTTSGVKVRAEAGYVYGQSMEYSVTEEGIENQIDSALFKAHDYARVFLKVEHFHSLSSRFVLIENLTMGYLGSDRPYVTNAFQLGGVGENVINQVQFYGLVDTEIKTEMVGSLQLGLQCKLSKSTYVIGRANVALYNYHGQTANTSMLNTNFLSGYGLTFGVNSPMGPIEVTSMFCDQDGRLRTNLNLGYRFLRQ